MKRLCYVCAQVLLYERVCIRVMLTLLALVTREFSPTLVSAVLQVWPECLLLSMGTPKDGSWILLARQI